MTTAAPRIQTGLRMDPSLLKVCKGLAELLEMSLADLVEGILLHALEGKAALTEPTTLASVTKLREVYGLTLTAGDSHTRPELD